MAEKLREQSGTPDPPDLPKTISSGNSGILKEAADLPGGEEENASVEGNEHDQKETSESPAPVKQKWYVFETLVVYLPPLILSLKGLLFQLQEKHTQ